MVDGYGIPLDRVLAPANRHDSPLLAPTLDKLDDLGPLPDDITVHLDAGYDSQKTRDELKERGMTGQIAHKACVLTFCVVSGCLRDDGGPGGGGAGAAFGSSVASQARSAVGWFGSCLRS